MIRTKMSREDRAKQFMPFAALKGYPQALRKKEESLCKGECLEKRKDIKKLDAK